MTYTLRRYETSQRLWWFLFLLVSLGGGYLIRDGLMPGPGGPAAGAGTYRTMDFWTRRDWLSQGILGEVIVFLVGTLLFFLLCRALWLLIQFGGKASIGRILEQALRSLPKPSKTNPEWILESPEKLMPAQQLFHRASRSPLRLLSIAHKRLIVLFSGHQESLSAEELTHREHRVETVDWHQISGSWESFRWMTRVLPFLALGQGIWLLYLRLQPILEGSEELADITALIAVCLLPFGQTLVLVIALYLAQGLLSRLEHYYLARLDALFYDQLLSRLPLQSSDTLMVLQAMKKHFQELQQALQRIEQRLTRS